MEPIKNTDDPRFTAYALGELEGDAAQAVERFLEQNPEARGELDAIRAFGDTLGSELLDDGAGGLEQSQRETIREHAASGAGAASGAEGDAAVAPVPARQPPVTLLTSPLTKVAALLLVAVGFSYYVLPQFASPGEEGVLIQGLRESKDVAMGRANEDERGVTTFSAEELSELRALGYVGGAGGSARDGGGTKPSAVQGKSAGRWPFTESADPGVSLHRFAPEPRKGGPAQRFVQTGPMVGSVTTSAAAGNPNAGVYFEDGRDQVYGASSESLSSTFAGPGSAPLSSGPLGFPLKNSTADDAPLSRSDYEDLRELGYVDSDSMPDYDDYVRSFPSRPRAAGEGYAALHDNPFVSVVTGQPLTALSTFAVDVDRASYANVRRFLNRNQLPPADAVRLEELVNAFVYADAPPGDDAEHPFAVHVSSANAPWAPQHRLVRVALKGKVIAHDERPPVSLTFLCDVSGSMQADDKLPLLKSSLKLLLSQLGPEDHVSLVTYASGSKVVLPPTSVAERSKILAALDGLVAGGSTAGAAGLQLAYQTAESVDFGDEAVRRILLCTDGDFNVGISSQQGLHDFIAEKAKTGVFLTVLGFGTGNYQDQTAETLADRGNGQYAYIDSLDEAHRVLVQQLTGTLVTIAQDVKLQLEFNPAHVGAWRQLGYENRQMAAQDFRNDKKDAGEIGAGHSVVAYYEIVPVGAPALSGTADLKYQAKPVSEPVASEPASPEWLTVNLRYKQPGAKPSDAATEFNTPFIDDETLFAQASDDYRFGAAVLHFGMALRGSPHRGDAPLFPAAAVAEQARGVDPHGDRAEFVKLVRRAVGLLPGELSAEDWERELELSALGYVGPADDH